MRIQVANVSRRFPQILVALAENLLSLTVAGLLAPVLTETNVEKVLSECAGMTKREAEEYRVGLRRKPVFVPSIRRTPLPKAPQPAMLTMQAPEATAPRPIPRVSPSILEPAQPEVFNFRFAANQEFKQKFERLAEILGVENPLQHMAEIMEQAIDIALDKKDVKRKSARRMARNLRNADNLRQRPCLDKVSRYLPSHTRERVHKITAQSFERGESVRRRVYPEEDRCLPAGFAGLVQGRALLGKVRRLFEGVGELEHGGLCEVFSQKL